MMEQKNYDSPTKSPVIQEIIMSNRIGAIAIHLAKQLNIDNVRALKLFYESKTLLTCMTNQLVFICMVTFM